MHYWYMATFEGVIILFIILGVHTSTDSNTDIVTYLETPTWVMNKYYWQDAKVYLFFQKCTHFCEDVPHY